MEAEKIETESNALSMRASEITIATQKQYLAAAMFLKKDQGNAEGD